MESAYPTFDVRIHSHSKETGDYYGTRRVTPEIIAAALSSYFKVQECDDKIEVESITVSVDKLSIFTNPDA